MAVLTLEITVGGVARAVSVDGDQFTLGMMEDMEQAQESGKLRDIIPVVASLLGLTHDETRALTMAQWRGLLAAMQQAVTVPNVSG